MDKSKNRLLRKISAVALASAIVVSGAFVSGFFNKSYNENGYAFSASAAAPPSDNGSRLSASSTPVPAAVTMRSALCRHG